MRLDLFGPRFPCTLLDPPWPERGGGKIKRGADRHYGLVKVELMPALVRSSPLWDPADHAHVWCWVTSNYLRAGLWLLEELGVRYVRDYVWVKTAEPEEPDGLEMGIGQYARGSHELLLFGVRGRGQDESVWTGNRSVRSVIYAPVPRGADGKRIHSRKPDASYELIEKVSKGPRAELFARRAFNETWHCWGNEAPEREAT